MGNVRGVEKGTPLVKALENRKKINDGTAGLSKKWAMTLCKEKLPFYTQDGDTQLR